MNINKLMVGAMTASLGLFAYGNLPVVSNVTMTQDSSRNVTITYTLDVPAVVTLDVQTNSAAGWVSIGGVAVSNAKGDVWKKMEAGSHTINWRPDLSWPGYKIADGGARAVVTAWALNNTPDYMVVDISPNAQPETQRYYPSVDFLPNSEIGQAGAITNNPIYKASKIVMRKIMAKYVNWMMGSTQNEYGRNPSDSDQESLHQVFLTNNYYIGVFPVTQGQWSLIQSARPTPSFENHQGNSDWPVENVSFNEIRMAANEINAASGAEEWPAAPYAGSFLDLLRTKTGIDFDLPSETEWEFAARAGNGDTKYGDGSRISNDYQNLARLGHFASSSTTAVGSYKPNDWGLYDVLGNVWEWCLDCRMVDPASLTGSVNTVSDGSGERMIRGGAWGYAGSYARPACRFSVKSSTRANLIGFRLACKAGLD